jgi:RHS repeat-associated protein
MTDHQGEVVWQADYKPFGQAVASVEAVTNNLRFPGQYYDEETGLHYNYFRYYNPTIGRYMRPDPIGFGGGDLTLYGYAVNSPNNKTDPLGLADVGMAWWPSWPPDPSQNWMSIDPLQFSIGLGGVLGIIDVNWNSGNPRQTNVSITTPQMGGGFNLCISRIEKVHTSWPRYGSEPSLEEQPFHYSFGSQYLGFTFTDNFDTLSINLGLVVAVMPVNVASPHVSF